MTVVTQPKARQAAWASRPKIQIRQTSPAEANNNPSRPLTATLEHPLVLNASLLTKIDMTAFTKEGLLAISKICAVPLIKSHGLRKKPKNRIPAITSMEDEDSSSSEIVNKSKSELKAAKPRKKMSVRRPSGVDAVFGGAVKLPEPCRTCGRPEQPERLHSHPVNPVIATKSAERTSKPIVRTPITKPVPANFKSAEKLRREQESKPDMDRSDRPRSGRPRTITCYICAREFGTASFPLHEPKCKQKWERENQQLPKELRRKLPEKPSGSNMGLADWNDFAWQAAQAALVPCGRCGRTFNPDRLVVHQRSCKVGLDPASSSKPATPSDIVANRPPTVPCYICGREFGTRSIAIHEPQCLRKWNQENSQLPQALQRPPPQKPDIDMSRITGCYICGEQMPVRDRPAHERACLQNWRRANSARPEGERLAEPMRPDYRFTDTGSVDFTGTWHSIWTNHMDSLIPCRTCGRKFFPDRIERHEIACANLPIKSKTTR